VIAMRELDELSDVGWRPASEALGLSTEWRPAEDGSLWVRIEGELSGALLMHAAAVAHEADLWPRWVPFCGGAETLRAISPFERLTYVQFDLTPMMKRGAVLHWSLSDVLMERRSLLLLGASIDETSVDETSPIERPAQASGIKLAHFKAIKVLISPLSATSCHIKWVTNLDLHAGSLPSALVSMVTKKLAGAILSMLAKEAHRLSSLEVEAEASGAASASAVDSPHLRRLHERPAGGFYAMLGALLDQQLEMYGEEAETEPAS